MKKTKLKKAIESVGGPSYVAAKFTEITGKSLTKQAVHQWDIVPAKKVKAMEIILGIPRHKLRPDLYDETDARSVA